MMKFILLTTVVIISLWLIKPDFFTYSRCDTPIYYKLGSIDPRFKLDSDKILSDIQQSADVWSRSYGQPLFLYSPTAQLTINFVYDQRTALDFQIDDLKHQVDQKNTTLQKQIESFQVEVGKFEQKLDQLNAEIDKSNLSGGASPELYQQFMTRQNQLNQEGQALNDRARQLNLSTKDYNSQVRTLNQDVSQFNQAIDQRPEEGLYNPNDFTITIYFVTNHQELLHTLSHEFGHALGLDHTTDPTSIMYPYTSTHQLVTSQDQEQLDHACRQISIFNKIPLPALDLRKLNLSY